MVRLAADLCLFSLSMFLDSSYCFIAANEGIDFMQKSVKRKTNRMQNSFSFWCEKRVRNSVSGLEVLERGTKQSEHGDEKILQGVSDDDGAKVSFEVTHNDAVDQRKCC
jgi:hypothetical protein